jgi:hypothetical protein
MSAAQVAGRPASSFSAAVPAIIAALSVQNPGSATMRSTFAL